MKKYVLKIVHSNESSIKVHKQRKSPKVREANEPENLKRAAQVNSLPM